MKKIILSLILTFVISNIAFSGLYNISKEDANSGLTFRNAINSSLSDINSRFQHLSSSGRSFKGYSSPLMLGNNSEGATPPAVKGYVDNLTRIILLSQYGVTGSGDETVKVQSAFDAILDGTTLVFDTDFETKSPVYFPTTAKTFKISGRNHVWTNYTSSALITRPAFASYSGLSVSLTSGVDSFTVPGGVSLSVGDFVYLRSDIEWITDYYPGSVARIYELSGGKAYLDIAPWQSYTGNRLDVYHGYENLEVGGITFDQSGTAGARGLSLQIVGVTGGKIHDNEFSGADVMQQGFNVTGNNVEVSRNMSEGYLDLQGTSSRTGYCYAINGNNITLDNNIGINCKHNIEIGARRFISNNILLSNNYLYQDPAYSGMLDSLGNPYFWTIADTHANVDRVEWSGNTILGVTDGHPLLNVRNGRTIANDNTFKQLAGTAPAVIGIDEAPLEYLKISGGEITMLAPSELISDPSYYPVTNISGVKTTNVDWDGVDINHMYNIPHFFTVDETNNRLGINNTTPFASVSISSTATSGNALELIKDSNVTVNHGSIATYKNNDTTDGNAAVFTFGSKDVHSPSGASYVGVQIGALFTSHAEDATRNTDFFIKTQKGTAAATEKFRVTGEGDATLIGTLTAAAFAGDGSALTRLNTLSTISTGANTYLSEAHTFVSATAAVNLWLDSTQTFKTDQVITIRNISASNVSIIMFGTTIDGSSSTVTIPAGTTYVIKRSGTSNAWYSLNKYPETPPFSVIDNLTTASSTDALSAGQGKNLKDAADLLSTRIPAPAVAGAIPTGADTTNYTSSDNFKYSSNALTATNTTTAYGSSSGTSAIFVADTGTAVDAADRVLAQIIGRGAYNTSHGVGSAASIDILSGGAFTDSTHIPGYIRFRTADASGARTERLRISSSGVVSIPATGTLQPTGRLLLPMGEISYFSTSGTSVVIASSSDGSTNMVKAAPTTTLANDMEFDNGGSNNGRLRYTGAVTKMFHVACTISIAPAAANDTFVVGVAKNGTVVPSSKILTQAINANAARSTAMHVMVELATNDYLELYVGNTTDADDATILTMNMFAMGM